MQIQPHGGLMAVAYLYLVALVCLFVVLASAGCGTTSADRMAALESGIDRGLEAVEQHEDDITAVQDRIAQLRTLAASSDLGIADQAKRLLEAAESTLETLFAKKSEALASIEAARAELERVNAQASIDWTDELKVAGKAVEASAPLWGPHGWLAGLIGGLLGVPALIFAGRKRKQASVVTGALTEVVRGASSVIAESPDPGTIKRKLKQHQSPLTRALVDQLRPATA